MKILDLFSGLEGFSQAFKSRGHEVFTIDLESKFDPDLSIDIFDLTAKKVLKLFGHPDVILASPPCNNFSVLTIPTNWKKELGVSYPKNEETKRAIELIKHTISIIKELKPRYWVLENPMGMLRKQEFMKKYKLRAITQCQYGREEQKPTDLWGDLPPFFKVKSCKRRQTCHTPAPRGTNKGIQGLNNSADRAKLPFGLSLELCKAAEKRNIDKETDEILEIQKELGVYETI